MGYKTNLKSNPHDLSMSHRIHFLSDFTQYIILFNYTCGRGNIYIEIIVKVSFQDLLGISLSDPLDLI